MKTRALALASVLIMMASPWAYAHCFSIWKYPWRQSCGFHGTPTPPAKRGEWFVEITTPPPVDERTPEQIQDQAEHDKAMKANHDKINHLMDELRQVQTWGPPD